MCSISSSSRTIDDLYSTKTKILCNFNFQSVFCHNRRITTPFLRKETSDGTDERDFQLFTRTIDEITMNYQMLLITHVEISSQHFIKIHGQTNRVKSKNIEYATPTMNNIFATYPAPVLKMLHPECMVLVYYKNNYCRGKFMFSDTGTTANVLLIDLGYMVHIEIANLRILGLASKASEFLISEPPLASEFILNRCIIFNDNSLSRIKDEILDCEIPYSIDDEIGNIKRISLQWNGRDYTDHLINSQICQEITADNQKKYLIPKPMTLLPARPVNKTMNNSAATVRSSINPTGMQMINNHLCARKNKVPQNMPSFHPRVSPSMDFNLNHAEKVYESSAVVPNEQLSAHYVPTFISDTLIVNGRHQVYVSYVDDGPYMFSIQLKSSEQKMEQMMAAIAKSPLKQLSRKPALGMACLARYSADNEVYRAVIKSINPDSCQLLYVDYGNSDTVSYDNIYDISEQFLRLKTFAIRVSLAGLKTLPALSDQVKNIFKDLVADKTLDMVVVPSESKVFVQYCELSINGESMLHRLKNIMSEVPKFIEPTTLNDNDFVVIRYVESPKLFCVQQTKNIVEYNAMIDKLCQYCITAPPLNKFQNGIACAARFKDDTEWYRAEIVNVIGRDALIRFVDYGIELKTDINSLKEIRYNFLVIPKQAVRCCLVGFESMQPSSLSQDQMELLAEDSLGERRNFKVKIHGNVEDAILVNLTDESQLPHLNLSMRMLQLSMPPKSFRQLELRSQHKPSIPRSANVPPSNDVDQHLNATVNEKTTSDSGFQDCASSSTRISNWDTPQRTADRDNRMNFINNNSQNSNRNDSGVSSSNVSTTGLPETFKIDVKESKFYKNNFSANAPCDSNEPRTVRPSKPYTSSNLRYDTLTPQGSIHPDTEIPTAAISVNTTQQVKLSWMFSPLEFYVTTVKSDADLNYTTQMKNIHHFYKNKPAMTRKASIGSFVIVKYSKNDRLHRAKIIDFDEKTEKYKAQLIDVGALTMIGASDLFEMDKIFADLECQAIKCSFSGVAMRASRLDTEDIIVKLMDDKILSCKFVKKKADTFYVDIFVDGLNVKDKLIRDEYLSILAEDIEIERLVGQNVMAQIVSVKNLTSFQMVICGCDTVFEASYPKAESSGMSTDKKLPLGVTIPVRIDSLLVGKTFSVFPLIESFGETPLSTICSLPFFSDNFKVFVMHWETYNIAYIQSETAHSIAGSMLDKLFEFYDKSGVLVEEFVPQTLCAVKSADENWYRAEIVSETQTGVNVRYLDYGNCELIPKSLVKKLEPKFYNTAALAVKVFLPLQKVYNDRETSVDENVKLTADVLLDLKVLEFFAQNWIVHLYKDDVDIMSAIKAKNCCKTIRVDELKKQIVNIEMVQKAAQLQVQKQRSNHDAIAQSTVTNVNNGTQPVSTSSQSRQSTIQPTKPAVITSQTTQSATQPMEPVPITSPRSQPIIQQIKPAPITSPKSQPITQAITQPTKPAVIQDVQPVTQPNTQPSSRMKAYISHIDRPDRFYLQTTAISQDLDQLQVNIQIVAPSLPPLENFSIDTLCIVRYSVDDQWYRAAIIDSDKTVTSILFIDYGNTDSITDHSLIKSMTDAFDQIPPYAIPCALPLVPKDRNEWSEESCELLKNLVDIELEFEYVCQGKSNNFVKLFHGDRDIMQELILNGYATKLESIIAAGNCYISHVNSISDFYIQLESDTDALEKVGDYLLDVSKFEVMTNVKEGAVCAAKYLDDGMWYRAKILSHKADSTEVFFIDYGNSSATSELRIIPTEIANASPLAKYCSMVKPKDIQYWSDAAEQRFVELTEHGAIFCVEVVSPSRKSIVDLLVNKKSILEEISNLCDKYSLSALENTLQSSASSSVASESFKAQIVDGSPSKFYVQLESDSSELDRMWVSLENAKTWPVLKEIVVGQICAAVFDGNYYRAKILSLGEQGAIVHFLDYGNQSFSGDLRDIPENLKHLKPLAICCCLESRSGTFSPKMIERFENLSRDVAYEMKFVSKDSSPAIVQLFDNGVKFDENTNTEISKPTEYSKVKAYISEMIGPNHFYIQLNNDMESAMTSALEFPPLEDSYKCAGKRCAALWEGAFYRAEILAIDEHGIKVHFIDYGNESYATDLRKLPENLEKIERASMLCTLQNDTFSNDFVNKFTSLDLDKEYEFEVINQSNPRVVRLLVDGELFSDGKLGRNNEPKNGRIQANSDNIVNGIAGSSDQRSVSDENSLNGTNVTNSSSTITDMVKEANRIQEVHFESIKNTGLASFPA